MLLVNFQAIMKEVFKYFRKNKWILLILFAFLSSKTIIQYFSFPPSASLTILRVLIFIIAIVLSLVIVKNVKYKFITAGLVILFSFGQGFLNLWEVSAERYVESEMPKYKEEINSLIERKDYSTIYYRGNEKVFILDRSSQLDTLLLSDNEIQFYSSFFNKSDFIQVEKNRELILFIMYRFIDNGYGLGLISDENFEKVKKQKRYRINGLEITGMTRISGDWCYISFT